VYLLYSLLTSLGLLLTLPYWLVKGLRQGKYLHNLRERLGHVPDELRVGLTNQAAPIWVHAVSVGEVLAAGPLVKALKQRVPQHSLIISTTTDTGQRLARERLQFAEGFFYFPLDWTFCIRRVFNAVQPCAVIVLETEIWPNFLRVARQRGVPVVLVNGRISPRSFARYLRSFRLLGFLLQPFARRVLGDVRSFLMQTWDDAARLVVLGAQQERVLATGNLKYDQEMPAETPLVNWLGGELKRRGRWPVMIAGSVVAGEEPLVLQAFAVVRARWPRALLLLAPRKPERFEAATAYIRECGFGLVRRSGLSAPWAAEGALEERGPSISSSIAGDTDVLLLDTVGELASLYRIANVVFIGGSLVPSGGHNPLEAAVFGKAPIFGPSTENFRGITASLLEAEAAIRVRDSSDLGRQWVALLEDDARREQMGARARALVEKSRGAVARALEVIVAILHDSAEDAAHAGAVTSASPGTPVAAENTQGQK
jgi:3-deoxy-D-manno-octulosonic-acid transferase